MALAYGKNPKSYEDPDVLAVNRCLERLGNALRPGVWKVDVFPFLRFEIYFSFIGTSSFYFFYYRYIPGYLTELQVGHAEELTLFKQQLHDIRLSMVCVVFVFIIFCCTFKIRNRFFKRKETKKFLNHLGNTFSNVNKSLSFPITKQRI
jgi:hypothetical protein